MFSERTKSRLINSYEPAKAILIWSGTICALALTVLIVIGIWYLIPVLKGAAHNAEASARNTESVTNEIKGGASTLNRILGEAEPQIKEALNQFVEASKHANRGAASVDRQLPVILSNIGAVGTRGEAVLAQGEGLVADLRQTTLPAVNASLLKLGRTIEVTGEELPKVVAELQRTGEDVRLILEQPSLRGPDSILDSLNRTAHSAEVIPVDLHAIGVQAERATKSVADGANDVQLYVHNTLFPPPCVGKGCFVKKWILQPLKAGSGLLYLILKAQSGQL